MAPTPSAPILEPYWWEAVPREDPAPSPLPGRADVAVVGSGYAGLSAAITLARAGREVVVLEKDRIGEGASTRNGGITSGNIKMDFGAMIEAFGLARAKEIHGEGKRARAELARFVADEGIECANVLAGRFTGAMRPAHYERIAREADLLARHLGLDARAVPRAEQHAEIGTDLYHGGVVRPDIGGVHPALLHRGMLERARDAGAAVHGRTRVTGLRRGRDGHEVATARATIRVTDVVVATNGYTGPATPWLRRRIVPVPSQIIATEPLETTVMDRLMPRRRMLGETRHLYHYFRPSPEGTRIVFGGRGGAHTDDPIAKYRHLHRDLLEIFPGLDGVRITHSWWGYTGYTFDFLPKLAVHDGVHYAAGFCGSGVVWARWLGRKAALRVLGDPDARTVFDETAFETRPLYRGRPWFLPPMIGWLALKDRLGL